MSLKVKLVGYFLLLSLLPLAAATLGFRAVVTSSETRRVDVRLEAGLRAVLGAYADELDRAARRADRLAASPDVQRALQRRDRKALEAAIATTPNIRMVGPGVAVGRVYALGARREALVRGPNGKLLARIVAQVPMNQDLLTQLRKRAGLQGDDRLVAVRSGRLLGGRPDERLVLDPRRSRTVDVGRGNYRALEAPQLQEPRLVSFAILADQSAINGAIAGSEHRLVLGLIASLVLIGLVAYVIGRSIVRSLGTLSGAADEIAQGRQGVRVPVRGSDEFALLSRSFNTMASQLELRLAELSTERIRLREVTSRLGQALAATHDSEDLRRAVVETAVEASGAAGGLLVGSRGDPVEVGQTDVGTDRIELPLRTQSQDFGTLVLNAQVFTPEQREVVASLASHAVIALENARLHRIVERQALLDGLTGLANRRHADEHLATELHRAQRFSSPLAVVLADLDDFKRINDVHGHPVGDTVLREFARTLRECVRDIDLAGRWGGEEFILVLPGTDVQGAAQVAERVREAMMQRSILAPDGSRLEPAASFGVAGYPDAATAAELVAAADAALYTAKRAGKDRVVIAPAPMPRG